MEKLAAVDRTAAVDMLRGLVSVPSLSRHEQEAAGWLAAWMRAAGYDRAGVDEAGNAVGEIGAPDAVRTIILLGHIDTVPGKIPVRIEPGDDGDVLFGRGSVDAKGPLATFAAAAARLGPAWARAHGVRVVVAGAVEEEAATSKGARFIAARFDGVGEPRPDACVIGEPSHWHRITLGYKGRLLMDIAARQPMAHTAGPDAGIAVAVVELWNRVARHAAEVNAGREKAFDQLSPSLRRFVTSTSAAMDDEAEALIAWRLPMDVAVEPFVGDLVKWLADAIGAAEPGTSAEALLSGTPVSLAGARATFDIAFRGWERPWRGDRQNALVRSFLAAIRDAGAPRPGFVLKTGTSDMNVVGPVWQCPIVAYGPGDSALDHTPHEHVSLDEYWRAITVVETMLRHLANTL